MRNLILVAALALLVLSPLTAAAQQKPVVPPTIEGVSTGKVVAIGVGAILGSVVAQAVIVGEGVGLVGGVAGGLLAWWWYDNSSGATRAALRQPIEAPSLASAERLAMAR